MWAGGYALDLYCDKQSQAHVYDEFPHQYFGELGTTCRAKARSAGWTIRSDGSAICPKCSGKAVTPRVGPT